MLQIEDLRLGVLLYDSLRDKTIEVEIKHFQQLAVCEKSFISRYLPIQISEEWLLNFGMKEYFSSDEYKFVDNNDDYPFIDLYLRKTEESNFLLCETRDNYILSKEINTVHHLQILYKSLTGKQLKKLL